LQELLLNSGIVRNRLKIAAAVANAKAFVNAQREFDSFNTFIWQFVGGKPVRNSWKCGVPLPARTPISDEMSAALRKRGFKFVGSTICYAIMQAVGMVNDHCIECFRHSEI
jgi:DNA-3-methyladenine glycosylase I